MGTASIVELSTPATGTPKGLRVLLVEDHADCAASMALLLRGDGHEVKVATDGSAALDEAQNDPPDVVFLDIGLPGEMDGYEVAKRLQGQIGEKTPLLVALTGFGNEADRRRSSEAGIDLHLVKPADIDDLLRLLKRFQRLIDR